MRLILVRHPAPDVPAGVCYGRLDLPLRPDTAAAISMLVADLADHCLASVWSSPARRCLAVAEALAQATGIELCVDARLRELDFGDWEGRVWDSVPRAALDAWAADPDNFAPPGGESGAALLRRVHEVHRALIAAGRDCAVVSHGGPLKLLAALLRNAPPDLLAAAPAIGSAEMFTV